MAEITSTNLKYTNFRINKRGLYESSPEPKEGFVEVVYGDKKDKKTYHRYVNALTGKVTSVRITTPPYGGEFLNLVMVDNPDAYSISVPLYAQNGNYSYMARLILDSISQIDFSKKVQVSFYTKKVEDNEYQNMSVSYDGEFTEDNKSVYAPRIDKDEKPERKYKELGGKKVQVVDDEVNFYFNILEKLKETLKKEGGTTVEQPKSTVKEETPKGKLSPAMSTMDEEDELPF